MKTAMQHLLYIIENAERNANVLKCNGFNKIDDINTLISTYNYFRIIIEKDMLVIEKEQIQEAYSQGYGDGVQEPNPNDEYYEQTYNQNK